MLGPIHKNQKDDVAGTDLQQIDPTLGSKEDFDSLLQLAKKKSGCPGLLKGLASWTEGMQDRVFVWLS